MPVTISIKPIAKEVKRVKDTGRGGKRRIYRWVKATIRHGYQVLPAIPSLFIGFAMICELGRVKPSPSLTPIKKEVQFIDFVIVSVLF
jgi:hypothetical protein